MFTHGNHQVGKPRGHAIYSVRIGNVKLGIAMAEILFNALPAQRKDFGISRYCYELGKELVKQSQNVRVAIGGEFRDEFPANSLFYFNRVTALKKIFISQLILPLKFKRFSLIHSGDIDAPLIGSIPIIVTLHDLTFYRHPDKFGLPQRLYRKYLGLRSLIMRAEMIICVSEFTKNDAIESLNLPPEKLAVIHSGVRCYPVEDGILPPEKPYILFVGTIEPKKNILRLLKAFDILKTRGLPYRLILAGSKGYDFGRIAAQLKELDLKDVIFTGFVDAKVLNVLYKNADLLVLPSLHEGFGFTPLEAMTHRIPTVVSNVAAIPEICGPAAYYIDPYDVESIAEGMYKVLTDTQLKRDLIQKGIERAKLFTWAKTAEKTLELYKQIS